MTKVTLRIDRLRLDAPGVSRAALEAALHREIARQVESAGVQGFVEGGHRPQVRAALSGTGPLSERIASATLGAVKGGG